MCKSAIYTANTGPQSIISGGTVSPGSIQRRFGDCINLSGNGITLTERGYYDVDISMTVNPIAVGTVTATLHNNGVPVPGATASAAVSTAGNAVSLSIDALVRVACCGNAAALTVVLTGNASTVNNIAVVVEKI